MNKQYLMLEFLRHKNITFDMCNKRQKQILLLEKPNMWDFYTWNL